MVHGQLCVQSSLFLTNYLQNRYISPLGYIVIIVSFHDPNWSKSVCNRYVLYPEILKIFTATAIGGLYIQSMTSSSSINLTKELHQ